MLTFVRTAVTSFRETGSIVPSSRFLAREIVGSVDGEREPMQILETGAGSGAFTRHLLERLRPGDSLIVNEINPAFVEVLERDIIAPYRATHDDRDVRVVAGSILDAPIDGPFHAIVCGIPMSNFAPELSRSIMRRMRSLLRPDGELRYFEYYGLKTIGALVVPPATRRRIRAHQAFRKVLLRDHGGRVRLITMNFPPARVIRVPGRPVVVGTSPA